MASRLPVIHAPGRRSLELITSGNGRTSSPKGPWERRREIPVTSALLRDDPWVPCAKKLRTAREIDLARRPSPFHLWVSEPAAERWSRTGRNRRPRRDRNDAHPDIFPPRRRLLTLGTFGTSRDPESALGATRCPSRPATNWGGRSQLARVVLFFQQTPQDPGDLWRLGGRARPSVALGIVPIPGVTSRPHPLFLYRQSVASAAGGGWTSCLLGEP